MSKISGLLNKYIHCIYFIIKLSRMLTLLVWSRKDKYNMFCSNTVTVVFDTTMMYRSLIVKEICDIGASN